MQSSIARKMLELRERLGESQEVFADRFGVQQGTVSRWENGKSVPKRTLWGQISKAAQMPAAEFFFDAVSGGLHPAHIRKLLVASYHLLGAREGRAELLADLVLEEAAAQIILGPRDPAENAEKLLTELRNPQSGDQSLL